MKKAFNIFIGTLSIFVVGASIYAAVNARDVLDWYTLRNYTPTPRIVELADQTTMNDQARRVFYVNKPSLQDKVSFRDSCISTEQSIILGCFIETKGIYLLDVQEERLNGVMQVTSAHEVLHAFYERLSKKDRANVDRMTSEFFATLKNDRIKKTVENYRKKDSNIVPNELHSILGTEVRDLSPELEAYYARYFKDRKVVVGFSEKYEQTFIDLNNQVAQYDTQLKDLKARIDANQQQLQSAVGTIDSEKKRLDNLLARGQTEEYNSNVPGFNTRVNSYNSLIRSTKSLIDQYNDLVDKRNAITTTEQALVEAIDANSLPKQQ